MGLFNDSSYINSRQDADVKRFDEQTRRQDFKRKYGAEIADGLTKSEYLRNYGLMNADLFDEVQAEVKAEQAKDEAIIAGLRSVPIPTYNH
jgi:hypothetical protein